MVSFFRTTIFILGLFQLTSCVIFYPGRNFPQPTSPNQPEDLTPLELSLSKYPVNGNERHNTLYATVINYKERRIANIELIHDTLSFSYSDSLHFKLQIWNFDKTDELSTVLSLPLYTFQNLKFQKLAGNNFSISSSEPNDSIKNCLLRNPQIQPDRNELFFIHSGQLINGRGSEVNFWAQTDVAATKVIYAAIIIATNSIDNIDWIKDLCKYKIDAARAKSECNQPTLYVTYYTRPFAEIFDSKIWNNFYRDCTVKIDCTKKK